MKTSFLIFLLLVSLSSAAQQNEFIVPAGAQKVLTPSDRILSLNKLSLGDNATIIIPPEMNGWSVTARDVSIGNNVKIISNANIGIRGPHGSSGASGADCRSGWAGVAGRNGGSGMPGKNVSLNLKIRSIGSLLIQVNGTNGGDGGNGGNGGKGGNSTCSCNAGNGGNAGSGGNGGNGGIGGVVSIVYSKTGKVSVSNSNFLVQNSGGRGGVGGGGGIGGQGGAGGGCTDPKAAARKPGLAGANGARGSDGVAGRNGSVTITAQ